MTYEGLLALTAREGAVKGIVGAGRGKQYELEMEPLSKIVDVLNDHFGMELGDADQLLFNQFEESWAADKDLTDQAKSNSLENFRLVFIPKFINTIVTRMDANEEIFKKILDDSEFQTMIADFYVRKVYSRLRN